MDGDLGVVYADGEGGPLVQRVATGLGDGRLGPQSVDLDLRVVLYTNYTRDFCPMETP